MEFLNFDNDTVVNPQYSEKKRILMPPSVESNSHLLQVVHNVVPALYLDHILRIYSRWEFKQYFLLAEVFETKRLV